MKNYVYLFLKGATYLFIGCLLILSCEDNDDTELIPIEITGEIAWLNTYGGSNNDSANAIIETADGGFAVLGVTNSIDGDITTKQVEVNDFWLLKLNADGSIKWSKTYGGSDDDVGRSLVQTNDGGYAIAGYSKSSDGDATKNEGLHDNWLLKLDANGGIEWEKSFGYAGHDHLYSILQTPDGGYFLGGFLDITASNGEGATGKNGNSRHGVGEFWAQKLDANGQLQWRRYFGGSSNDRIHSVLQANDGGYILVGFTESADFDVSNSHGSYDYWVIKISNTGQLLWEKTYGGAEADIANAAVKAIDGNYVIAGQSVSNNADVSDNHGNADFWVIKINDQGELLWEKSYGGTQYEAAWAIDARRDGSFVVAGNAKSVDGDLTANQGFNDFWVIQIASNGDLLQEKSIGGSNLDFAYGITATSDGSLVVVGDTESSNIENAVNKGFKDALLVKIN